jgi:hypothetical protein
LTTVLSRRRSVRRRIVAAMSTPPTMRERRPQTPIGINADLVQEDAERGG